MNIKEYIASGIIESYVLGIATELERKEFEELCVQYPEVTEARNAFEQSLEERLLADAPAPPFHLKGLVEEKLVQVQTSASSDEEVSETPVRRMNPWKWVAAASLVLLAGAAWWGFDSNRKYQELRASAPATDTAALHNLTARNQELETRLQSMERDAQMLAKSDMKMASLKSGDMYATIFWDTTSKDVYMLVGNMPQPASDKQYQLWALLNGKPIDLGMIEVKQERMLYQMKNVRDAQAFAITLEPKGGSPQPTSNPIVVRNL